LMTRLRLALSTLITPVVRGAFSVAPMHVADAPVAGSGKSYLFDTASAIATGQLMPVIAAGRNEEETEKRLGSAMIAGQPLIAIDNVNSELRGDALCQIIERSRPQVRVLGKSELINVETRGTTIFANGNNITVVGDLCRRVIRCRLDPKLERPEEKVFAGNPVATILADRGAYIAAALTICRAYIAQGRPNLKPKLASFEGWSDTVRSALVWLGKEDPVDSMELVREEDPDKGRLAAMLEAWANTIGVGPNSGMELKDVITMVNAARQTPMGTVTSCCPDLNAAVRAVVPLREPPTVINLGYWLRNNKLKVVGNRRFVNKPSSHGTKWWVESTDNPDQSIEAPF